VQQRHGFLRAIPARHVHVDALARVLRPAPVDGRQRGQQFQKRPLGGLLQIQIRQQARRLADKQRLNLRLVQPRQIRAILAQQRPTAARPALRDDGNPRAAQGFHVAVNRPRGNFQTPRQIARGQLPVRLQQQHNGKQPVRTHFSSPRFSRKIFQTAGFYLTNMTEDVINLCVF
jgi:hypothetical protein